MKCNNYNSERVIDCLYNRGYTNFLNRKEFSYGIEQFDKLLASSDNFILYQEDIMKTLVYAGFSEDVTYGLLKAIAKKKDGIIEPIHDKFIEGFVEAIGREQGGFDE